MRKNKVVVEVIPAVLVLLGFLWFLIGFVFDSMGIFWSFVLNNMIKSWLFPGGWNLLHATPFFWILVIAAILSYVTMVVYKKKSSREAEFLYTIIWGGFSVGVLIVIVFFGFAWGNWNAEFYNASNEYKVISTTALPSSLTRVESSEKAQVSITEGELPTEWEGRSASSTGAAYVMKKTGDTIQNTALIPETISYVDNGDGGTWTAIRNGVRRQPIYGVTSWSGSGNSVETCTFSGDYSLNKAFGGLFGMNLGNSVKSFAPSFIWSMEDVYGYCDGEEPVIVIPGRTIVPNRVQAALEPAGVITVKGSPTGKPIIELVAEANGQVPGGVYPKASVAAQRDALSWSAGRVMPWNSPVGFVPTSNSGSQSGNNQDFQLRNKEDGHLYWVTPLKPLNAESETISAYALTRADEVSSGNLNTQNIYVLNDNDPNIVNFNDLENAVTQAVSKVDPGFFTGESENQGKIVEFIPTSVDSWKVFAERGGRAVYEIHLSGGSKLKPEVRSIDEEGGISKPTVGLVSPETSPNIEETGDVEDAGVIVCGDPEDLTDAQIAYCISKYSEELSSRLSSE